MVSLGRPADEHEIHPVILAHRFAVMAHDRSILHLGIQSQDLPIESLLKPIVQQAIRGMQDLQTELRTAEPTDPQPER